MKPKTSNFIRSDAFIMFLLVLLAAIPRLYLLIFTEKFSSDGVSYLSTALYLRDPDLIGEVPKRVYFILYPLLSMLIDTFTQDIAKASRILNQFVGLAIPPLTYLLGRRFLTKPAAILAGLFCVINPVLIEQSAEIRGDNLFALLTLIAILFFESADWSKTRISDALIFGLIIGFAQLSRTNGIIYLMIIIPIWVWWIKKGIILVLPWLQRTLIPFFITFIILFSVPYILLDARGEKLPSMFVYTFLDGNIAPFEREEIFFRLNIDATEYQILEDVSQTAITDVFTDPQIFITKYISNFNFIVKMFFDPVIRIIMQLSIFLLPLAFYLFYYWGEVRVPSEIKRLLFWTWPSFIILPAINVEYLYYLPFVPLLMLVLSWLINTVSGLGWISKWQNLIFVILSLIVFSISFPASLSLLKEHKNFVNPYLRAGEWLNQNTESSDLIMARNPEVFFHAFRRGYRMPNENLDRTLVFLRHKGIKYIIFGPAEQKHRKDLFFEAFNEIYQKGETADLQHVVTIDTGVDLVYITRVVDSDNNSP